MSSSSTTSSETFLHRFVLQGKLISQLIAFWWRHHDENPTTPQQKAAQYIGESLYSGYTNPSPGVDTLGEPRLKVNIRIDKLKGLFSADPAKYLDEHPSIDWDASYNDPSNDPNLTLITVFGQDRIKNRRHYLSPIFDPTELDPTELEGGAVKDSINNAHYKFTSVENAYKGTLTDPEQVSNPNSEDRYAYKYAIPVPPKGKIEDDLLDQWVSDESKLYPPNPYIPFST
jgi:hypothetical protein